MFVETKETSFEQLEGCIYIMNEKSYWKNPVNGYSKTIKKEIANKYIKNRKGYAIVKAILTKYHVTTLYELNKEQIDYEVLSIHKSAIYKINVGVRWKKKPTLK